MKRNIRDNLYAKKCVHLQCEKEKAFFLAKINKTHKHKVISYS